MLRKIKTLVPLLALGSLTAGSLRAAEPTPTNGAPTQTNAAAATQPAAAAADDIVAKGKGFEIRRSQLDKEVARAMSQGTAQGRVLPAEAKLQVPRQILEQLINVRLVDTKATAADRATGKAKAEKRLAQAKAKAGSDSAFESQLKRMGATQTDLLSKWTEALTGVAVLEREFKIRVTDAEARKFYDDNPNQFQAPEKVRASHILVATRDPKTGPLTPDQQAAKRKQAEALLKRARAGEDFAKLAREFSDDPVSRDKGGEYVFARGEMVPAVETAAFALEPNQISDIVTSSYGYHIIKLSEKIPAHRVPYAEAAADIKSSLTKQAIDEKFPEYIANLRTEAGVEILDVMLLPRDRPDPGSYLRPVKRKP